MDRMPKPGRGNESQNIKNFRNIMDKFKNAEGASDAFDMFDQFEGLKQELRTAEASNDTKAKKTINKKMESLSKEMLSKAKGIERENTMFDIGTQTDLMQMEANNSELNYSLGIEDDMSFGGVDLSMIDNTNPLNNTPIKAGDGEYVDFLKNVYGVDNKAALVMKLRQKMGLVEKTINPLKTTRQSSFIGRTTQSRHDYDYQNFLL